MLYKGESRLDKLMDINYLFEVFGVLVIGAIGGSIYRIYNKNKKIKTKNKSLLSYSEDIDHNFTENNLDFSYGRAELNIDFHNDSIYHKSIQNGDLQYKVSNFKNIKFDDILIDVKFIGEFTENNMKKVESIVLYCINNAYNLSYADISISIYAGGKQIKYINESIKLEDGDIKEVIRLHITTKEVLDLFKENDDQKLKLVIELGNQVDEKSLIYKDGNFLFNIPGGIGSGGGITKENKVDLIIDKNEENSLRGQVRIDSHHQDMLRIKLFSSKSCEYNFELFLNEKVIFLDKVKVIVPRYNNMHLDNKIFFNYNFSNFMNKNSLKYYNIYDGTYSIDNLPVYNKEIFMESSTAEKII